MKTKKKGLMVGDCVRLYTNKRRPVSCEIFTLNHDAMVMHEVRRGMSENGITTSNMTVHRLSVKCHVPCPLWSTPAASRQAMHACAQTSMSC